MPKMTELEEIENVVGPCGVPDRKLEQKIIQMTSGLQ
jgi:hypothetical protein